METLKGIVKGIDDGVMLKDLAESYGIDRSTVSKIKRGLRYRLLVNSIRKIHNDAHKGGRRRMSKKEGLKIISLDISNVRRIKAFRVNLEGKNLHVAGDVAAGKTTSIDALWDILTKGADTLRHGTRKGVIRVKLAGGDREILAERVTTAKTSSVKIFDESDRKISVKEFNMMISSLSVNPHKIKDMTPKDQVEALLRSAKVGVDLNAMDETISEKETLRLALHRDAEKAKPAGDRPPKVERVNVATLINKLGEAEITNKENAAVRESMQALYNESGQITDEKASVAAQITEMQARLKELDDLQAKSEQKIIQAEEVVENLEDEDTQAIKEQISSAEEINSKAVAYDQWVEAEQEWHGYEEERQSCDEEIKDLREEKKQALEAAEWPIEGLSISGGEIYYEGNLLENLGESEQMLVCAALAMNDILAHDIRVVRMDGVESMSEDHMQKLVDLFNGHGIQVLSTRVARGDINEGEIEIVDGEYTEE
jgi:hypothetical protein